MKMVDGLSKKRAKYLEKAYEARDKLQAGIGLQSWGFVHGDGSISHSQGAPCLVRVPHYHTEGCLFFVDRTINPRDSRISLEDSREYINYVLNKSYWRHPFVTKDPEEVFNKGVIIKTNYPTRYCLSASIAIRFVKEWPDRVHTWNKINSLVNHGDLALMLAHRFLYNQRTDTLAKSDGPRNHPMLTRYPGDRIIRAVVEGDYNWLEKEKKFSMDGQYRGLTIDMPGGEMSKFSCPDMEDLSYPVARHFNNTLGLPDTFVEIVYKDKDKVEADWAKKVINLYLKGQKNEEGADHKPKCGVRKAVRGEWMGINDFPL